MKKSFIKKVLITASITAAVTAMTAVSAMAATYDKTNNTVSTTENLDAYNGQQMTVVVIKDGAQEGGIEQDEILYIDQVGKEAGQTIFQNMGLKSALEVDTTYVIRIGGENVSEIIEDSFTVTSGDNPPPAGVRGDVDNSGEADVTDASWIVQKVLEIRTFTPEQEDLGDVNDDGEADVTDASWIVQYVLEIRDHL